MESIQEKKPNKFIGILNKLITAWIQIFSDKKKTFYLLFTILAVILLVLMAYPSYYGTYLNCNTDDILQYYPYINGFFVPAIVISLSVKWW